MCLATKCEDSLRREMALSLANHVVSYSVLEVILMLLILFYFTF